MRFYRLRWEETRGDRYADWGGAVYWFAVNDEGIVERQFEVYDDGHVLLYHDDHVADAFGMLPDQRLDPPQEDGTAVAEVTAAEYVAATASLVPSNR